MILEIGLLFPYIVHYYHLENGTQKLYTYYDRFIGEKFGEEHIRSEKIIANWEQIENSFVCEVERRDAH